MSFVNDALGAASFVYQIKKDQHLTGAQLEANAFNAEQAQLNRDFQSEMSNSQYQRTVSDMKAAGLNPATAAGNAVSSPAGNTASSVSPSQNFNAFEAYMQMRSLKLQQEMQKAQIQNVHANTKKTEVETDNLGSQKANIEASTAYILDKNQREAIFSGKQVEFTDAQIDQAYAMIDSINANVRKANLEAEKTIEETENVKEMRYLYKTQALNNVSATMLNKAKATEILSLLPFQQNLLEAQSETEKVKAAGMFLENGYKQRLFTTDYIDALKDTAIAEARMKGTEADIKEIEKWHAEFKQAMKSGNLFDYRENWSLSNLNVFLANSLLGTASIMSDFR